MCVGGANNNKLNLLAYIVQVAWSVIRTEQASMSYNVGFVSPGCFMTGQKKMLDLTDDWTDGLYPWSISDGALRP